MKNGLALLLLGLIVPVAGCGGGATRAVDNAPFVVAMTLPTTPLVGRVYSRSLAVVSAADYSALRVTPSGATPIVYTDADGNVYPHPTLESASRSGWCSLTFGSTFTVFYNVHTQQFVRYEAVPRVWQLPIHNIFTILSSTHYVSENGGHEWDGKEWKWLYDALPNIEPHGGGGSSVCGSKMVGLYARPAIYDTRGLTLFTPLSSTQDSAVTMQGGDGNYYGYSRRGSDSTVAVKWTPEGVPTELVGVGTFNNIGASPPPMVGDVNASGDILASPMLYRGSVLATIEYDRGSVKPTTGKASSIADDGSILVGDKVLAPRL